MTAEVVPSGGGGGLSLAFDRADGSTQGWSIPNGWTRLIRRGVPAGTYQLSLKRNSQRVSDVTTVTIEDDRSTADVVLREVAR